jgi:uncharacterized protein (TIGR00251 family)
LKLTVKITPNAKKSEIVGFENSILKVKIAAAPVDGKANEALVKFLAKEWKIPKTSIQFLHGESSRTKVIEVPDDTLGLIHSNDQRLNNSPNSSKR